MATKVVVTKLAYLKRLRDFDAILQRMHAHGLLWSLYEEAKDYKVDKNDECYIAVVRQNEQPVSVVTLRRYKLHGLQSFIAMSFTRHDRRKKGLATLALQKAAKFANIKKGHKIRYYSRPMDNVIRAAGFVA